jgi:hypothetical protein
MRENPLRVSRCHSVTSLSRSAAAMNSVFEKCLLTARSFQIALGFGLNMRAYVRVTLRQGASAYFGLFFLLQPNRGQFPSRSRARFNLDKAARLVMSIWGFQALGALPSYRLRAPLCKCPRVSRSVVRLAADCGVASSSA